MVSWLTIPASSMHGLSLRPDRAFARNALPALKTFTSTVYLCELLGLSRARMLATPELTTSFLEYWRCPRGDRLFSPAPLSTPRGLTTWDCFLQLEAFLRGFDRKAVSDFADGSRRRRRPAPVTAQNNTYQPPALLRNA